MNFATPEFLVLFLPTAILSFALAKRFSGHDGGRLALLALSLAFYALGGLAFLWVLAVSIIGNHWAARILHRSGHQTVFWLAVAANLGMLGWFKYAGFVAGAVGADAFLTASVVLPLGISFFTFQQIAWLVDVRRGEAVPSTLLDHALFVSFFPQLIAGPIVHHAQLGPQLKRPAGLPGLGDERLRLALVYLFGGLAKKVLIADPIGDMINPLWADVSALSFYDAWVAALGYGIQLYFDFSAYGEMAIGLGLLFGIELPKNFNSPYKAVSVRDFWRRWHITLGAFLRDYLYIALGGSKRGFHRQLLALMATMVLGGLWHGAGWTFLFWGAAHGAAMVLETAARRCGLVLPDPVARLATLAFVLLAWVPFRASNMEQALIVYGAMFGSLDLALPAAIAGLVGADVAITPLYGHEIFLVLGLLWLAVVAPNLHEIAHRPLPAYLLAPASALAMLFVSFEIGVATDFLYWQW